MTFIINVPGKKIYKTPAKKCDSLVSETMVGFRRNLKSGKMSVSEKNLLS